MMKILLINPIIEKPQVRLPNMPEPLGLEYLAAMLIPEHEVYIIDGLPTGLSYDEIINTIKDFQPNIIGISVNYSFAIKVAKELSDIIKKHLPDSIIVLGGNNSTFLADDLIKHPSIDIIVLGEGELTFKELIEKWEVRSGKCDFEHISGLCYKTSDGKIKFTPKRPVIKDLDTLPLPAHSILKNKDYYERTILTARGCGYNCIYCSSSSFWGNYRPRRIESIVKEIESLFASDLSYSTNRIVFIDDTFTIDKNRVENLCKELARLRNKFDFVWACHARIENMTEELLITMAESGCCAIGFGIESGSPKILNFLKRKYTPDDVINATKLCAKLGIRVDTGFMVGLPYEEKEDLEQTFALMEEIPGLTGISILTPFPGTPIFNEPDKYQLTIIPHSPEENDINKYAWLNTGYLTGEEILAAYQTGLNICFRKVMQAAFTELL